MRIVLGFPDVFFAKSARYDFTFVATWFKKMTFTLTGKVLLIAGASPIATASSLAQSRPIKSVKIVAPATAGSLLDIVARSLDDKLKDRWIRSCAVRLRSMHAL
jgi:hypothetical protein